MLIGINNSLLSASLHLGIPEDNENRMRILVNTGTAMNTGNLQYHILQYHMWVMSYYPEIVDKFVQCVKDTAYDVMNLVVALNFKDITTDVKHG